MMKEDLKWPHSTWSLESEPRKSIPDRSHCSEGHCPSKAARMQHPLPWAHSRPFPYTPSLFLLGHAHLHISLTSLSGENPTLIFSLLLHCIYHAAGAPALDHGQGWQLHSGRDKLGLAYSCRMLAPWSHTDWWSLILHSDGCSWGFICWQGWMKKKDSHWKQIYEKLPIPHTRIEGETISMLIW